MDASPYQFQMTTTPRMPVNLVNVRGTALLATDTREQYRQKLARITLDSMVQFVGLLDAKGTVLEINQVALDAVGIDLSEVEGRPFWTTFWWQVSEEIRATLRESILRASQGEFVRWDTDIYGRAGGKETIVIDASLCPVKDEQGNVVFIAAEGRDITEKKAYEREIARQREELARLDELKTQFFANISHEFRTPLTLLLGPVDDALHDRDDPLGAQQRERITMIQRNGLRLQKLVNALLDFSRVEAGRIQAVYKATDLASLTQDLASSFRSACEKAGLILTIETQKLPEPVFVDHEMWEKIVLNLVSNAFKFTLEGQTSVTLCAESDHAVLRVSDTGTGIPEAELPLIFDRFHRVEGARGRTYEGTGIGLALIQELVKLHKGSIEVASALGRGTSFSVRIPFGSAHLPNAQVEHPRTQVSTATRADAFVSEALRWLPDGFDGVDEPLPPSSPFSEGMRPRVLLADDNADMRDYLSHLLATTYAVTAAADGKEALVAATRVRPDLILTDVMMPHVDGFGLLQRLRADPTLREIPVIVLSARAGEEAKVEGLRMGADDYLVKPFSARELLARVAANIELARTRAQSAQVLRDEAHRLELLNRIATALAAEIEVEPLVQLVTDAATELTGAQSGAFVYNVASSNGDAKRQFTLSGDSRESFAGFPQPLVSEVRSVVRSGDIREDPRYFNDARNVGLPASLLPVVSYLSVPVIAPNGDLLGRLSFAHTEPNMFTEHHELIVTGIASQAALAFEKARLYEASRNAEAALRQLNETLEQRVTAEVAERMKAEQALRQAQKLEAIGHLTGGVAHDFNNLLQVVLGSLEALKRRIDSPATPSPSDIVRSVDIAMRGAERAASLTQRLLAFSRQQPLDPRPTDVNRLITGMSELLRRTLGESIAIDIVLGGGLWWTSVDPNQLENAILNLAVNARDAMPDGGRLTIESGNAALDENYAREQQEVRSGQYVMLAISDTGTGMTKDVVASAFDPFFTTKEPGQGTGLGLSQVYGFVKQSNGHVKICSEPGEGTTIRIYFPRLLDETCTEEQTKDVAYPVGNRSEMVLLVEDNEAVRQTNAAMLDELGYAVIEAENAAKALKIIETTPSIRLLFTDVGLPDGINGRQLADLALQRRPSLKVLFTTGYVRNAIVHGGRLDPGIQLIGKPFTVAALAIKLRELLDEA